jgi:hypothetical protein
MNQLFTPYRLFLVYANDWLEIVHLGPRQKVAKN